MTGLNWFQGRDLAKTGVAIRDAAWEFWLIYRLHVWQIWTPSGSGWTRRVVRSTDFGAAEFMGKNYTDEPWDGGTYPPCSVKATGLAPNSTGGAAAWGPITDCVGVVPVTLDVGTDVDPPYIPSANLQLTSSALGDDLIPDGGGGTCYTPSHTASFTPKALYTDLDIPTGTTVRGYAWFAPAGVDLHVSMDLPYVYPSDQVSAIDGAQGPTPLVQVLTQLSVNAPAAVPLTPGATYQSRVDVFYPDGSRYSVYASLTLAPACP